MASAADSPPRAGRQFIEYLPILIAIGCLVVPTMMTLAKQSWSREIGAHGPLVAITGLWLLWRERDRVQGLSVPGNGLLVAVGMALSLPLYVFGRAYDFISLEAIGLYGVCLTWCYSRIGEKAMASIWFPLFYFAFLIPPPGFFMDHVTAPLKILVSTVATNGLSAVGIPISREGVTLWVAQYQLLVEDACSGMNSLTGLTAISLFYIYLLRGAAWSYHLILVALVIPIAIIANIVRIVILILLTYFFGNEVGQGFLHEGAGMLLFATALMLVFLVDRVISPFFSQQQAT